VGDRCNNDHKKSMNSRVSISVNSEQTHSYFTISSAIKPPIGAVSLELVIFCSDFLEALSLLENVKDSVTRATAPIRTVILVFIVQTVKGFEHLFPDNDNIRATAIFCGRCDLFFCASSKHQGA
jgi:hypothetical protein